MAPLFPNKKQKGQLRGFSSPSTRDTHLTASTPVAHRKTLTTDITLLPNKCHHLQLPECPLPKSDKDHDPHLPPRHKFVKLHIPEFKNDCAESHTASFLRISSTTVAWTQKSMHASCTCK